VKNFTAKNFLERMLRNFENRILKNEKIINSKKNTENGVKYN
jgi:hypothetical protein